MRQALACIMATRVAQRLVSKKKRRLRRDEYELDLSYIWPPPDLETGLPMVGQSPRLITMGFPSENGASSGVEAYTVGEQERSAMQLAGMPSTKYRTAKSGGGRFDAWYRNPMDQVKRFFETYHEHHYKIFNFCSERWYDHGHFCGRVSRYPFADHNCPPLAMVHAACCDAAAWLLADPHNVVAFHCKAGKGRAGLMTTCLLLHMRWQTSAADALEFYALHRTHNGQGVTIPSQRRYAEYYALLLERARRTSQISTHVPLPQLPMASHTLRLRSVRVGPFAGANSNDWATPFVCLERQGGAVWSSSSWGDETTITRTQDNTIWKLTGPVGGALIRGDVYLTIHNEIGGRAKAGAWLCTGLLDPSEPECQHAPIGCTDITDDAQRGFQVSISKAGLDKAYKKDWASDSFAIVLDFDVLDFNASSAQGSHVASQHTLCWDLPGAHQNGVGVPSRGAGLACCAGRPH